MAERLQRYRVAITLTVLDEGRYGGEEIARRLAEHLLALPLDVAGSVPAVSVRADAEDAGRLLPELAEMTLDEIDAHLDLHALYGRSPLDLGAEHARHHRRGAASHGHVHRAKGVDRDR